MKKTLFFIACIGWMLSLSAHVLSMADYNVKEQVPFVWLLHFGIFLIALPAIYIFKKENTFTEFQKTSILNQLNPVAGFKVIFKNTPKWLSVVAFVGLVYAFFNFFISFAFIPGTTAIENDQYILENHGVFVRTLTEQEYHHIQATEIKGVSGHWLAFYGIAAALLFPFASTQRDHSA